MLRRHQGVLDEAQRLLEKESQNAQAIGDGYTEAWAQHELGELLVDRGDLSQARSRLRRALELRQACGLEAFVIDTVLDTAKLMLEEGDSKQALAMAERVCTFYARQGNHAKEGWAHALRARVLLVRGETTPARGALKHAQALSGQSEDIFIMAEVLLTRAWAAVRGGSGAEREQTARLLQEFSARCQLGELKGLEFQARLSLAELHHASGLDAAGAECMDLEQEARLLGYLSVARKAHALAQLRGARPGRS
jgi:tetratricopeptide (TPR) repeat protein